MCALAALGGGLGAQEEKWDWSREAQIGTEVVSSLEAESVIVDSPADLERLQRVTNAILPATPYPDAQIRVRIIEDKEINAISVPSAARLPDGTYGPGGSIYVTTALLKFARSDDELAGVLAHELAHTMLHHAIRQMENDARQEKRDVLWIALAAGLSMRGGLDSGMLVLAAQQMLRIAKMHQYTITLEEEADCRAVAYLARTTYSPVGLLTFLEHLSYSPAGFGPDPGIFQTHPDLQERIVSIIRELHRLAISINRRRTIGARGPQVVSASLAGVTVFEVRIGKSVVFRAPATEGSAEAAAARAEQVAGALNALMRDNLQSYEVEELPGPDGSAQLRARGTTILIVTAADGAFFQTTPEGLAHSYREALRTAFWLENFPPEPQQS